MAVIDASPAPAASEPFEHLVLDFLAYLEFERGLSRNTLEAYRSDLLQYGAYLGGRDALAVTHSDLAGFVSSLAAGDGEKPPVAPATLQRKVACLRSFHRHLRRQGLIEADPTANLRAPKQSRRLPEVLSRDEVAKLLEQPRGTEPPALRDRALLELMYACGLRASEAIDLELSDLDLEAGILRARGKGSKERIVPVGSAATRAVNAYLSRGRPKLVGDRLEPRLFVNHRGAGLTRQGLYKIVQRHAESAGLAVDHGVLVDAYLETSAPGIFAAGDAVRWPDPNTGERIRVEHWVVAERQGQTAALNMLARRQLRFTAPPFFWSRHYDASINYVGHAQHWDAIEIDGDVAAQDATLSFRQGGRIAAVASVGQELRNLQAEAVMEERLTGAQAGS